MQKKRLEAVLEDVASYKNHPFIMEMGGTEFRVEWYDAICSILGERINFLSIEGQKDFYLHFPIEGETLPKEKIIKKFSKKYQKYCNKYFW